MRIVILGRQQGKTTKLLEWMREAPDSELRVYVGHTSQAAMDVYRSTFDEDENPTDLGSYQFIGLSEVRGYRPRIHRAEIVYGLDNLDLMFRELFNKRIGFFSMTREPGDMVQSIEGEGQEMTMSQMAHVLINRPRYRTVEDPRYGLDDKDKDRG